MVTIKYSEGVAKSAEYMKQAIPLMTRHGAGFHPISYAVWYEYSAGTNTDLIDEVKLLTSEGELLDNASLHQLYDKHIAGMNEETAQRISNSFEGVLSDVSETTSAMSDNTQKFNSSLTDWKKNAESSEDFDLRNSVVQLLSNAEDMQGAVSSLQDKLERSQQEIQELKKEVDRSKNEALTDALTGLLNRKGFEKAMTRCLLQVKQGAHPPSLMMMDIDFFKKINDTYGHLFGDKVISSIAKAVKQNVKGKDVVARYGGEEFIVLLPETPLKGAQMLAERAREVIEKGRITRGKNKEDAQVTISVGVAHYAENEAVLDFIARADQALYKSKQRGRNRVTIDQGHKTEKI